MGWGSKANVQPPRPTAAPGPTAATTVGGGRRVPPPGATVVGKAVSREEYAKTQAGTKPGVPTPPDAMKDASDAVKSAANAAARMRKRLAAGTAGKVTLPAQSPSQAAITATGTPKTLIGGAQ